jgi:hypothetical protein
MFHDRHHQVAHPHFMVNGVLDYHNFLRAKVIYSIFNRQKRSPPKLIKRRQQHVRKDPK